MKQEYHYTISRTDRISLIAFVVVLLSWELVKYIIPPKETNVQWAETEGPDDDPGKKSDTNSTVEFDKSFGKSNSSVNSYSSSYEGNDLSEVSPVEIMTASIEALRSIGLSSKVAFNIKKYRASGGIINDEQDLMKIYGMDSAQLIMTTPFLIFPSSDTLSKFRFENKKTRANYQRTYDLNLITAAELESLPGIGPVLSERIMKYRDALGGFASVEQLKECYGLSPETFVKISPVLTTNNKPKTIAINDVDLSTFSHPYLHKKFPRMMKAYKDHHGRFRNASDLRKVYPPDSLWCEKLLPYLIFE